MMVTDLMRFYHTVRYLRLQQVGYRVWYRVRRPRPDLGPASPVRQVGRTWTAPAAKPASMTGPNRFRFLNEERMIGTAADWNNSDWPKLWLYNLHYFDDLNAAEAAGRRDWHLDLIRRWIAGNPAAAGNGWEPYPISLRIVNWIKWTLTGNELPAEAVQSLAVQTRYLCYRLEYHLLGNHLFANAKALVFAGLFFNGGEADWWYRKGLNLLWKQVSEQILKDGGHFERSPMYHAIILEDLLDLINIMQAHGREVPAQWVDAVNNMITWLKGMIHPDGDIVQFNDAALGIAPAPRKLFEYAYRLGFCIPDSPGSGVTYFDRTGYGRVEMGEAVAFLDLAPIGPDYLPGHAHADTLSFELSLIGQRVIVDSGTSCYGEGRERLRQRGTAAHNTVVVDGADSSEVWGGFRVARRAYPRDLAINEAPGEIRVACAHDGYRRLPGRPLHRREWQLREHSLRITDRLGGGFARAEGRFHFHPGMKVTMKADAAGGSAAFPEGRMLHFAVAGGTCRVEETTWHPEFGLSIANRCLVVEFASPEVAVTFSW
jgi:uncharacterized heparinase superfamily protein